MKRNHRNRNGRRNPGLKAPRDVQEASGQQVTLAGLPGQHHHEGRMRRWAEGADEIEQRMALARAETHVMVPMGTRPPFDDTCEVCGLGRDARAEPAEGRTVGRRVHW